MAPCPTKLRAAIFFSLLVMSVTPTASAQMLSKNATIRFLALGDSYTIGESVPEAQRWPVQFADSLQKKGFSCADPEIIAVTGWRTDQLQSAIDERRLEKEFNLVSLLIGVNNQYQGGSMDVYREDFEKLLQTAVDMAGNDKTRVFVLSIPDYGYTPFGEKNKNKISREIDAFNDINEKIAEASGVPYVYITDISRRGLKEPELVADDGLHPSGKMYALWVERILEKLAIPLR